METAHVKAERKLVLFEIDEVVVCQLRLRVQPLRLVGCSCSEGTNLVHQFTRNLATRCLLGPHEDLELLSFNLTLLLAIDLLDEHLEDGQYRPMIAEPRLSPVVKIKFDVSAYFARLASTNVRLIENTVSPTGDAHLLRSIINIRVVVVLVSRGKLDVAFIKLVQNRVIGQVFD